MFLHLYISRNKKYYYLEELVTKHAERSSDAFAENTQAFGGFFFLLGQAKRKPSVDT